MIGPFFPLLDATVQPIRVDSSLPPWRDTILLLSAILMSADVVFFHEGEWGNRTDSDIRRQ